MELRHLRYFVAVAETGSVTVAAETHLHTAQPSLSRQLRQLEHEVGTPLFVRGARGVALTPAGAAFLPHAREALAQAQAAVAAAAQRARSAMTSFRIGFLTGHEVGWLPRVTAALRDELPRIDLRIASRLSPELADDLANDALDAALLRVEPRPGVAYRVVAREPVVAILPREHRLAAEPAIDPRSFAGETLVGFTERASVLRGVVTAYFEREGLAIAPRHHVDNFAMAMSLVASTGSVMLLPTYVVPLLPASVISRPLIGDAPTIDLALGYRADNAGPVLRALVEGLAPEGLAPEGLTPEGLAPEGLAPEGLAPDGEVRRPD